MGGKTTKTVKVPSSKAEEWEEYVQEKPEVDSISHLIRLSVQKELNDSYTEADRASSGREGREEGEILTALQQLQSSLSDVESRLSAVEGVKEAEAGYDLQKAVFSLLPEERDSLDYSEWATTASEIADKLGANEDEVIDTLEELEELTGQVETRRGGPENNTYWFKKAK